MANITEFNAPDTTIRPSETGVEATARAGLRLGAYGNQIAQAQERTGQALGRGIADAGDAAYQQVEHHEISAGSAHGAELIAQLNQSWNNTAKNADPNDPSVAAKWRAETLEPALDQFRSGFMTQGAQQWAEHFVDQYRSHAFEKTSADMSSMAGDAVRMNAHNTLNSLTAAVFNDPSTLNFSRDALGHSLDGVIGSSPNLTAADAARVRSELTQKGQEQLVKAAAMGTIVNGGDWRKIAADPKNAGFINAPELQQFERQEKFYRKSAEVADKNLIALNKQIAEGNTASSINKSFADHVHVDPQTGHVTIDPQFATDMGQLPLKNPNDPTAAAKAEHWLDWNLAKQKEPPRVDSPQMVDGLMATIADPQKDLDSVKYAIRSAEIQHGLTTQTSTQMVQLATDMRSLNNPILVKTMEAAKEIVEPKIRGISDNPGAYAQFYYDFIHNHYLPAKIAGTLPSNALDTNDPKSMISQALAVVRPGIAATISGNGGVGGPPLPVYTAPKPGAAAPAVPTVSSKADYDKLKPGASFIGPDGKPWTKPAGPPVL